MIWSINMTNTHEKLARKKESVSKCCMPTRGPAK
jgi:hypothetical protein